MSWLVETDFATSGFFKWAQLTATLREETGCSVESTYRCDRKAVHLLAAESDVVRLLDFISSALFPC
jgi:hypothetical protein